MIRQIHLHDFSVHHTGMFNFLICPRNIYSIDTDSTYSQIKYIHNKLMSFFNKDPGSFIKRTRSHILLQIFFMLRI